MRLQQHIVQSVFVTRAVAIVCIRYTTLDYQSYYINKYGIAIVFFYLLSLFNYQYGMVHFLELTRCGKSSPNTISFLGILLTHLSTRRTVLTLAFLRIQSHSTVFIGLAFALLQMRYNFAHLCNVLDTLSFKRIIIYGTVASTEQHIYIFN